MVKSGFWHDLTTADFAALDPARAVALLPVAAIEQHGPHLPLVTDSCIAEAVAQRALERLPATATVLALPCQAVGDSTEHGAFAGTLSLSPEALIRAWTEIGACVRAAGLRKLVILNSHGGQPQVVDIVAQKLRLGHGMFVAKVKTYGLGMPAGLFDGDELRHGIHGGAVETSMMLHLRPDLVRLDQAADFKPLSREMAPDYRHLGPNGPVGFAWATQDLHPAGACGDATAADAEKGRQLLDHMARALAEVLAEVERFPLDKLRERP